jgi:hypothetical protein
VTYRDEYTLAQYADATPTEEMRIGCAELAQCQTYASHVVDGELLELKVDVVELGIRIYLGHGNAANETWSARVDRWVHNNYLPDEQRARLV